MGGVSDVSRVSVQTTEEHPAVFAPYLTAEIAVVTVMWFKIISHHLVDRLVTNLKLSGMVMWHESPSPRWVHRIGDVVERTRCSCSGIGIPRSYLTSQAVDTVEVREHTCKSGRQRNS